MAAIKAQPLDYLRTSARDEMLIFLGNDRPLSIQTMSFTIDAQHLRAAAVVLRARPLCVRAHDTNTHPVQPYAYFMFLYQGRSTSPVSPSSRVVMPGSPD